MNGEDVAFVGISTPETYTKATPTYFQDEEGNFIYTFSEDTFYDTIQDTVDEAIAAAEDKEIEPVVVVSKTDLESGEWLRDIYEKAGIPFFAVSSVTDEGIEAVKSLLHEQVTAFTGPTGVGKTERCRALGEVLFHDENAMIRLDMSEYMEAYTVSKLIGSPPGYVGYDEGGQLTEAVRRKPYSVILFDEIEKAHPDVFNILLQLLDDGRLTDNQGRTVDFKNTIVIMTSNIGSNYLIDGIRPDGSVADDVKQKVEDETKKYFRPEFLNRIDEIVVFSPLTEDQIVKIIEMSMKDIEKRLEEREIKLELTDRAKKFIADESYDPAYGARPVKRFLQRNVETELAGELIRGTVKDGDDVLIDSDGEKLTFTAK